MTRENLLQEVGRRLKLIENHYRNYREYLHRRDLSKASEYLWGLANTLASTLSILRRGKPIARHRELREFLNALAHELALRQPTRAKDIERTFRDGILALETLHANFFHDFLNQQQFEELRARAETLIKILEEELHRELSALSYHHS